MSDDPALTHVPPDGTLGLLAYGYRGLVAWRAVRGTEWLDEKREQAAAAKAEGDSSASSLASVSLTVVSGLPRSGTSMLMQMLVAGGLTPFTDAEREADDSNPRGYYEHQRVKSTAKDNEWVAEADGTVVKVVSPLLHHLPSGPTYRVVLLNRDIDEVLRSQSTMLQRQGRDSVDPDVLRPAFQRHQETARRWATRVPTAQLLELNHADVISDPLAAATRLASFLGDLDPAPMAAVVDPSLHRERAS